MAPDDHLPNQLTAYCREKWSQGEVLRVQNLQRIFGGASRETWRFQMVSIGDGRECVHDLILRRDPASSLIDTERRREFAAYRAFEGTAVPVPKAWWLEEDARYLGSPFFVMEAVNGCEASPPKLMAAPYMQRHPQIALQTWSILGAIAKADPAVLAGGCHDVQTNSSWKIELDHWAGLVRGNAQEPQPITEAAIRWLYAHPPSSAQRLSIVHGDYRIGNLLVAPDGSLRAVLDWEMAHVGDPLEDLAWSINRSWCFNRDDRVGGIAVRADAISIWESASGLVAEPKALLWWEIFSCVKGQAIWLGAARTFSDGTNRDVMMAFAAWMLINSQERTMLDLMGHLA